MREVTGRRKSLKGVTTHPGGSDLWDLADWSSKRQAGLTQPGHAAP